MSGVAKFCRDIFFTKSDYTQTDRQTDTVEYTQSSAVLGLAADILKMCSQGVYPPKILEQVPLLLLFLPPIPSSPPFPSHALPVSP